MSSSRFIVFRWVIRDFSAVFARLLEFAQRDLVPAMPCKGSLGASGDLAPLAHMALPLIGKGRFWNAQARRPWRPKPSWPNTISHRSRYGPKDGLALINGTQLMAGYGAFILERALTLQKNADVLRRSVSKRCAAVFRPSTHVCTP